MTLVAFVLVGWSVGWLVCLFDWVFFNVMLCWVRLGYVSCLVCLFMSLIVYPAIVAKTTCFGGGCRIARTTPHDIHVC